MIKLFTILTLVFFVASCKTPQIVIKTVTKDSVVTKDTTIYSRDTTYLPGDSVEMWQAIPCPDAKLDTVVKGKGGVKITATINKGILRMKCNSDSLQHIIDSITRLKSKEHYHSEVKEVPVNVPTPYIPKWVWWLLAANVLMGIYKYRHQIIGLFV